MNIGGAMRIPNIIITVILALGVGVFLIGCGKAPEEQTTGTKKPLVQDVKKGTSFQDHDEGKYGPPGAGGYGVPKGVEQVEEAAEETTGKKKPLFQDVTEGTSLQDHGEGKYGPPGAGGYGVPKGVEQVEKDVK
jgi:hypothetical protein